MCHHTQKFFIISLRGYSINLPGVSDLFSTSLHIYEVQFTA